MLFVPSTSCVAIAIDIQNGFILPTTAHIVPSAVCLTETLQGLGIPVFATRFINSASSSWSRLIPWSGLMDPEEQELVTDIKLLIQSQRVLDKQSYSSFLPDVQKYVVENGVDTILIYGVSTDSCVLATTFHVFDMGLRPIVIADCTASSATSLGSDSHESSLALIRHLAGSSQVVSKEELINMIIPAA